MIHIYICHMRCQVFGSDAFFCAMLNEQLNKSAVTKMHLGGALQSKIDPIAYVRHSLLEISQLKLEMVSENAVAFAMVSSSFSMLNIMKPELATKLGRQIYYYDRRNETRLKRCLWFTTIFTTADSRRHDPPETGNWKLVFGSCI
jgi:hypothetical protein